MGIRGLTAFLKQGSLSSISDHVDLSAGTNNSSSGNRSSEVAPPFPHHILVIDGNAFSHWFCMECLGTAPSLNTDYRLLKSHVVSWIMKCHATKVDCIFVFDGSTEPDKLQCRLDRLCKQSANMDFALSQQPMCSRSNVAVDQDQNVFDSDNQINFIRHNSVGVVPSCGNGIKIQSTPPILAISCIINAIGSLKSTGTRAFYARGEADKIVVEVAVAMKATAIMSNDSDMVVYNTGNVGFIPFWAFGFANDGSLNAFIIKRRKLANLMGITEKNLPILAALVGNDFTSAEICYHMHKMLFEGAKPCKEKIKKCSRSQSDLTLSKLDLSHSDLDQEEPDMIDETSQRVPLKPKTKRGDSSMSASDRMKSRRRANKAEEENKRKANHFKFNDSSASNLSNESALSAAASVGVDDTLSESTFEVQSSLGKELAWAYGESGLKTVKAAADFIKRVEALNKKLSSDGTLNPVTVTACLLGISEEEVVSYLAEGINAEELGSTRRVESPWNGVNKMSFLCVSFHSAFEESIERYKVQSADEVDISSPSPVMTGVCGRSAIRCCFRCCHCTPTCSEIQSGSLISLLTEQPSSSERGTSVVPGGVRVSNLRLSPDMEQIVVYGLFIGRTPCSLHLQHCTPSVSDTLQVDSLLTGISSAARGESDYVSLQPLRRRIYSLLLSGGWIVQNDSAVLQAATNNCIVSEIYKKNASAHLERRSVIVSGVGANVTTPQATRSSRRLGSVSTRSPSNIEHVQCSVARLVLGDSGPPLIELLTSSVDLELLEGRQLERDSMRNQLVLLTMTARLFIMISVPQGPTSRTTEECSEESSAILAAVSFLTSCSVTLIASHTTPATPHSSSETASSPGVNAAQFRAAKMNEIECLSLPFVNIWTRFQVCLQHVNFSVEAAAWAMSMTHALGAPNQDLGPDSTVHSALMLLLGGDVGLMSPILFADCLAHLRACVAALVHAVKTDHDTAAATELLSKALRVIFRRVAPHTDECAVRTVTSVIVMTVTATLG